LASPTSFSPFPPWTWQPASYSLLGQVFPTISRRFLDRSPIPNVPQSMVDAFHAPRSSLSLSCIFPSFDDGLIFSLPPCVSYWLSVQYGSAAPHRHELGPFFGFPVLEVTPIFHRGPKAPGASSSQILVAEESGFFFLSLFF